jgi:hypothetical protein
MKIDFEKEILPRLEKLNSLKDCLDYFESATFWADNLKKVIADNKLEVY